MADFAPIAPTRSQGLVDVLDRILDKGLVRLLVCSIDKAEQIGLNWWKYDSALSGPHGDSQLQAENRELRTRVQALEERLNQLAAGKP